MDPGLHSRWSGFSTSALPQPVVPCMICHTVLNKCHIVLKYLWPCCPTFKNSCHFLFNAGGLKSMIQGLRGIPKALLGSLQGHNYFQSNAEMLLVLFTLMSVPWSFQVISWPVISQQIIYQSGYENLAFLSSRTVKRFAKMQNCHCPRYFFFCILENTVFFIKKVTT